MKLLVVIPAYNEAENIKTVVDNLKNYPYDYVIINDGSRDDTLKICRENNYNVIDMPINVGLTDGVQTGMKYALNHGYDCVVQFDGDGQHDPLYIAPMLEAMKEVDIAIGSRFVTEKKPKSARMLGSNIIQFAIKLTTGKTVKDPTSGMRIFGKNVMKAMAETSDYGPEPDTLAHLIRSGATFKEVQVEMHQRVAGESYLSFSRSITYMLHMVFSILAVQWFRKKSKIGGGKK